MHYIATVRPAEIFDSNADLNKTMAQVQTLSINIMQSSVVLVNLHQNDCHWQSEIIHSLKDNFRVVAKPFKLTQFKNQEEVFTAI